MRLGRSDAEDAGIALLDAGALLLDRSRVILQRLDVLQGNPARLFLGLRMQRAQSTDVDDELLRLAGEAERLEQFCRVRVRCALEDAVGADDHRRAFGR